jgi:glycerol dehydrogenase-like iron-containing ADH family enzyme
VSAARSTLRELAAAARTLHHRLLVATQKNFEKLHGRVEGPGVLLQLAVHNPLFAWLRPLSQQLALLDELAEADDLHEPDVARAAREVAEVLDSEAFRGSYLVYLQSEPDVVLANAALKPLLARARAAARDV